MGQIIRTDDDDCQVRPDGDGAFGLAGHGVTASTVHGEHRQFDGSPGRNEGSDQPAANRVGRTRRAQTEGDGIAEYDEVQRHLTSNTG